MRVKAHRQRVMFFEAEAELARDREIVVDCFAGGGGASLGIAWGIGRSPDVAINHDQEAVAMHIANHPSTRHWCENLWDVDPVEVTEGRPVGAAWFSPDCTDFSRAKGEKPVRKSIRGLAWLVLRWAAKVRPRCIFLENVAEFETWSPLRGRWQIVKKGEKAVDDVQDQRRPSHLLAKLKPGERLVLRHHRIRTKIGQTFRKWVSQLKALGYAVEWRTLVASDYGSPTSRKRLFLVARCDGAPIVWPEPTHGSPAVIRKELTKRGHTSRRVWRTAAECIDFSLPIYSIFMSPEEVKAQGLTIKRPLEEKTLRRLAEGIRRYVLECQDPFIVSTNHGGDHYRGGGASGRPLGTMTQKNGFGVATPFLARLQHGGATRRILDPLHTVTASDGDCNLVVCPTLVKTSNGERDGQRPRCLDPMEPLGTVCASGSNFGVGVAHVSRMYGNSVGNCVGVPVGSLTGENHSALCTAWIAKHFGGQTGVPASTPFPTVTSRGTQNQLATAWLTKMNHGAKPCSGAGEPLHTVCAGANHHAIATGFLSKFYGTATGADLRSPLPTVTGQGNKIAEVRAFLMKYYGTGGQWQDIREPLHTITSKDRLALGIVLIGGEWWQIVDIGMRMLTPRELFTAMGFPLTYDIETGLNGKPATKTTQTARCGNSVPPHPASVLVRANYQERKITKRTRSKSAKA